MANGFVYRFEEPNQQQQTANNTNISSALRYDTNNLGHMNCTWTSPFELLFVAGFLPAPAPSFFFLELRLLFFSYFPFTTYTFFPVVHLLDLQHIDFVLG
jgi:hypothetical protein